MMYAACCSVADDSFPPAAVSNETSSHRRGEGSPPPEHNYSTPQLLDTLSRPGPYDVLCDRHVAAFHHVGNKRFRVICEIYIPKYASATTTKQEKSSIFKSIIATVRGGGGNFLTKSGTTEDDDHDADWKIVGDVQIKDKIRHTLRAAAIALETNRGKTRTILDVINGQYDANIKKQRRASALQKLPAFRDMSGLSAVSTLLPNNTSSPHVGLDCEKKKPPHREPYLKRPSIQSDDVVAPYLPRKDGSTHKDQLPEDQEGAPDTHPLLLACDLSQEPGQDDVLCDRSAAAFDHVGNKRFRSICARFVPDYKNAATKGQKGKIFKAVISLVSKRGGRFLARNAMSGQWEELSSTRRTIGKVGHALRAAVLQLQDTAEHHSTTSISIKKTNGAVADLFAGYGEYGDDSQERLEQRGSPISSRGTTASQLRVVTPISKSKVAEPASWRRIFGNAIRENSQAAVIEEGSDILVDDADTLPGAMIRSKLVGVDEISFSAAEREKDPFLLGGPPAVANETKLSAMIDGLDQRFTVDTPWPNIHEVVDGGETDGRPLSPFPLATFH